MKGKRVAGNDQRKGLPNKRKAHGTRREDSIFALWVPPFVNPVSDPDYKHCRHHKQPGIQHLRFLVPGVQTPKLGFIQREEEEVQWWNKEGKVKVVVDKK